MGFRQVAILMGGVSSEREISLKSGQAVTAGLRQAGYTVAPVVLERAAVPPLPAWTEAVFLALHGSYGEDGGIQADLDALRMPYTGSGAQASRTAMDKIQTKRILLQHGVPTPRFEVLGPAETRLTNLPLPVVVKPPRDGSSVGVARVNAPDEWRAALDAARQRDARGEVLVESYIPGREWTVGVLGDQVLPVVEIRAPDGWYGFGAKYGYADARAARPATEYLFPADECDRDLIATCQRQALKAFQAVGCRGLARVDFRVAPDGQPYMLEINTIPGFTATSLLPKAAARAGIGFVDLCARIMETARFDDPRGGAAARQG
jgi:D-alanine-D-alanine ligase